MAYKGKVYIMGVGPGDYRLITLKAIECIGKADVIVYDRLVNERLLKYAREKAELIYVGKMPDCHAVPQEGINEILVKKALEGKIVARVKGGDPFLFGRGGEEAEALLDHEIEFEVIPGITSAISVPAYAGIPVTHRDCCSSLHIITGHERPDKTSSSLDYEVLAKLEGTLVFLMGVKNLPDIAANLIRYGKDSSTPAAVIEKGTTIDQRVVTGTLQDITVKITDAGIKSPAIIVIGDVVKLRDKLKWFPKGSLAGKRVVVTRCREQSSKLVEKVEELGGEAVEFPTIKIQGLEDYSRFDAVLGDLDSFNWLVFTSVNGVSHFFSRMKTLKIDIRKLAHMKICAVGKATAEELDNRGLFVDFVPEKFTTEALLDGLISNVKQGEKILMARADIANEDLATGLKEKNIVFEDLVAYKTVPDSSNKERVIELLKECKIDFVTFTSSSTVNNFVSIIGYENLTLLKDTKVVCIGPVTADTAQKIGLKVYSVAHEYTIDGLVQKLIEG